MTAQLFENFRRRVLVSAARAQASSAADMGSRGKHFDYAGRAAIYERWLAGTWALVKAAYGQALRPFPEAEAPSESWSGKIERVFKERLGDCTKVKSLSEELQRSEGIGLEDFFAESRGVTSGAFRCGPGRRPSQVVLRVRGRGGQCRGGSHRDPRPDTPAGTARRSRTGHPRHVAPRDREAQPAARVEAAAGVVCRHLRQSASSLSATRGGRGPEDEPRINRLSHVICVLQTLQKRLRCKEIWVEGADRFRNPDEDLPVDFETEREAYCQALKQPMEVEQFIETVQQDMRHCLGKLDAGLPEGLMVRLRTKGKKRIVVTLRSPTGAGTASAPQNRGRPALADDQPS